MEENRYLEIHAQAELDKIQVHATEEERKNLINKVSMLNGKYVGTCVYGLMTDSCFSSRAHNLIHQCAADYYSDLTGREPREIKPGARYFTALEVLVSKNRKLVIDMIQKTINLR